MTIEEFKAKHGHVGALATAEEIIRAKVVADRLQKGEDYCALGCGEGPFPISKMRLITREENPYVQMEDDCVRICQKCVEENDQFADYTRIDP